MARPCWALNLDADDELAAPDPAHFTRRRVMVERIRALRPRLLALVPADARIVDPAALDDAVGREPTAIPRCFAPTPSARAALARVGLSIDAPPVEVLRRVNDRAFAAGLGLGLPGARVFSDADALTTYLASQAPGDAWLLKRAFGFAGRGRRRVFAGALDAADTAWIQRSLADGPGLLAEPEQLDVTDFALHGYLLPDGGLTRGRPTTQSIDASGAWLGSAPADDALASHERAALDHAFDAVVDALRAVGYFGPFDVDAYRHRHGFQPLGELNARYTMGFAVGLPDFTPPRGLP
jgi:hypothetical protein